jgi:hypothetical protein
MRAMIYQDISLVGLFVSEPRRLRRTVKGAEWTKMVDSPSGCMSLYRDASFTCDFESHI